MRSFFKIRGTTSERKVENHSASAVSSSDDSSNKSAKKAGASSKVIWPLNHNDIKACMIEYAWFLCSCLIIFRM